MKTLLSLILTLAMSATLLMGCTAATVQSMEDTEADTAAAEPALQPETAALANVPAGQGMPAAFAVSGDLCAVCADEDCDGGKSCNHADQREEAGKSNTPCEVCGDGNCDGDTHCGGKNDRHNNHHGGHHGNHHHNKKPC